MKLEEDLAAWVSGRPDWQKDAVARFCRNESFSDAEVAAIADHLIAGTYPVITAITAKDIPGNSVTGDAVQLAAVVDIEGVNALLPGQRLTFGDTGLTVIYGDNASGKSGYARLIREAVTARTKTDLLGDVFAEGVSDQNALFEYTVGGVPATWSLLDETNRDLSSVRFYDGECGATYVTSASEISYRPSALTLLDRLSTVCDQLQQELAKRLSENTSLRPQLPLLAEGTNAKQFLDTITLNTTQAEIDEATELDADHDAVLSAKLQELARLQLTDPNAEKARLTRIAEHWADVTSHIDRLVTAVNADALKQVQILKEDATGLREAAKVASAKSFDSGPLAGVGSTAWRALWEAARQYSVTEAYHGQGYPAVADGAVCVLCQQPLSPEGGDRLERFESFIRDSTSRDADAAEHRLALRHEEITRLQATPSALTTALSQLQAAGEDVDEAQNWIIKASTLAGQTAEWIEGTRSDLPDDLSTSPSSALKDHRQGLIDASLAIDDASFNDKVRELNAEVAEWQARAQLVVAKENLGHEVRRLSTRAKIEEARRLVDTTSITRKATLLTTAHVTSVVRDQFTRETEQLHLRKITLDPTGGRRDVTLEHRPRLLGATFETDIDNVLSEGEQTALGLAGFLTEVEFDTSKSAVVLDDPVSSLDAGRRSRVAKRFVELAQSRQVIVFTHEVTFVNVLNRTARDLGVEVTERAIMRQGDRPGLASDQHPWSVKDVPLRIGVLEEDLARLQKDRDQLTTDEYTQRAQEWAGRLSQAWERAINLDVVHALVDQGTNEVRPRMFRMLVPITEQDDNDFQSGYGKASEWALRHDQAPETNFVAPEPDELEAELVRFKEWANRMKGYKR